jgi:YVTN family beta-propeller protein
MRPLLLALLLATTLFAADPIQLPNGLAITPLAAPRAIELPLSPKPGKFLAQPVTTALSPDGKTLLALTSGYNKDRGVRGATNDEYIFIYDATVFPPKQLQALPIPNAFCGLAFNPSGAEFYVSGGMDDRIYVFARDSKQQFARAAAIPLNHARGNGLMSNGTTPEELKQAPKPMTAGIAVNQSGAQAAVANFYNDSITLIDLKTRQVTAELDLRPGIVDPAKTGQPGGEYPYWIAIRADSTAYISSPRDREIVVVNLTPKPTVTARIPVQGQPNRLLLNKQQTVLYAALDNADTVATVDTATNRITATLGITAPEAILPVRNRPKGANPNSLALSPDQKTLYVSDGGTNAIAVIDTAAFKLTGLIPTGWYPASVTSGSDGKHLYIANGKSMPGPNPGNCRADVKAPNIPDCPRQLNSYVYQLEKGSLLALQVPNAAELATLTRQVAINNRFDAVRTRIENPVTTELRKHIQHVIYIVKENRTYDQVLGDLEVGNGDPSLAEFPDAVSPNHHALARNFVTLDNFLDSGEVSGIGWQWSTGARATDYTEKSVPIEYAARGFVYDWEGANRNVNVGIASIPERAKAQPALGAGKLDLNLLPGTADISGPDSDNNEAGSGYLWDDALRASLTVRNYGFFSDLTRYEHSKGAANYMEFSKTPFADKKPQAVTASSSLLPLTDIYFRGFDQAFPDFYRVNEWQREFNDQVANKNMPNLTLLRLSHDHFGNFKDSFDNVNTPALQFADNDYAIGRVAEVVARSPYADSTLIFIIEDDAQDGPDHMDAHRSVAYVIGPYVKQKKVISARYTTVNMIGAMEAVLGIKPSSLFAAAADPMTEVFDLKQPTWSYTAKPSDLLRTTQLPLPPSTAPIAALHDLHDAKYWNKRIGDMDYDVEDRLDTARFNRELWKGLMPNKPYPKTRSGADLSQNREALISKQ